MDKLEALTTINQVASRMYNELTLRRPVFDRHRVEADAIRKFSRQDAIKAAERYLVDPATRCRLGIHIVGKTEREGLSQSAAAVVDAAVEEAAGEAKAADDVAAMEVDPQA